MTCRKLLRNKNGFETKGKIGITKIKNIEELKKKIQTGLII
jgi:hypothetical protein